MAPKLLLVTAILLASLSWLAASPLKLESTEIRDNTSPTPAPKPEKSSDKGPLSLPKEILQNLRNSISRSGFESQKYQPDKSDQPEKPDKSDEPEKPEKLERRDDEEMESTEEEALLRRHLEFHTS